MKPRIHSLIEKSPVSGFLFGVIVSFCCSASYLLISVNTGLFAASISNEVDSINLRANLTLMILVGFLPTAHWYLRTWTLQSTKQLSEYFDLAKDENLRNENLVVSLSLISTLAFIFLFVVLPGSIDTLISVGSWDLDFVVSITALTFVGWWTGQFIYELVWSTLALTAVAKRIPYLNLFDSEATKPFTQQGVRSTLLIIFMMSITGSLAVQPGGGIVGAVFFSSMMLMLAIVTTVLPLRGIHHRIRDQKLRELHEIRQEITGAIKSNEYKDNNNTLTTLLAIESRIERVPEWPFDISNLFRVMLYLMLGLGSWVGAALVERLLENTF